MPHATAEGTKKASAKAERAVKETTATEEQRKNAYYAAGGVALGLATLGGLYYYDRQVCVYVCVCVNVYVGMCVCVRALLMLLPPNGEGNNQQGISARSVLVEL